MSTLQEMVWRLCYSNAPYRWVNPIFFHRWVLVPIGCGLAGGLPLALMGVNGNRDDLLSLGLGLCLPFLFWVALLLAVSAALAVPRFAIIGITIAAVYYGFTGVAKWIAEGAEKYEQSKVQPIPSPENRAE